MNNFNIWLLGFLAAAGPTLTAEQVSIIKQELANSASPPSKFNYPPGVPDYTYTRPGSPAYDPTKTGSPVTPYLRGATS